MVVDSSARPGAGYARNIGSWVTSAPLLAFCDADDEAAAGWLAAMVQALSRDPFVAGRFESGTLSKAKTRARVRARRSRSLPQSAGLQESPFGPGLPHADARNLGVRRDLFFKVGGFDPTVGCLEDADLCWRIQLTGVPLTFAPEPVMHMRARTSLRTMWSQRRAYAQASALLERRYPRPGPRARRGAKRVVDASPAVRGGTLIGGPARTG
jgi:GT2 family glycosyltransferase